MKRHLDSDIFPGHIQPNVVKEPMKGTYMGKADLRICFGSINPQIRRKFLDVCLTT